MMEVSKIVWYHEPQEHDYPAAESYLSLIFSETTAAKLVKKLRKADVVWFKAKDIFRAAEILHPVGRGNFHVDHNIAKIEKKQNLSPLLLVKRIDGSKLIIADGFHRLCGVHAFSEDESVPVKLVSI